MDWSNDNCPVCRNSAREALPRLGDFAEIICDNCGRFRISGSSQQAMLFEDNAQTRRNALEAATRTADDGAIPFIMNFGL